MLLIASTQLSQGRAAGFLTYIGIALGTYCHALAAALGLSQLFLAVPTAYEVVRWAGCAYLLYLAWNDTALRSDTIFPERRPQALFPAAKFSAKVLSPTCSIRRWRFFVLASFPQFLDPAKGSMTLQILVLATVLNLIGLLVNGAVILLSGHIRTRINGLGPFQKTPQIPAGDRLCRSCLPSRSWNET